MPEEEMDSIFLEDDEDTQEFGDEFGGSLSSAELMAMAELHGGVKGSTITKQSKEDYLTGATTPEERRLVFADGTYIIVSSAGNGSWNAVSGTALKPQSSQKTQRQLWTDPRTGAQWIIDPTTGRKLTQMSGDIQGYRPSGVPAPAQGRAPRWAEEEEYDKLQVEKAKLDIQKAQQGLENPYTQKMKYITEAYKKIGELQQLIGTGQIDEADAKRQMQTFQDWIQADMMGATPFQMQKDTRDFNYGKEVDRRKLASDVLGTRAQAGTSLANGLMNSLFGAYGKMYSGANPNYNIDYFGMVKGLTDEVTGGQDLNELGMAILKGAFSPKGGW